MYGLLDFLTGMEEHIVDYEVFQPASEFLNFIQTGAVRRKKYQFQTVSVLFQEAFQQLRMMDFCIIQNHDSLSMRILQKYIFQIFKQDCADVIVQQFFLMFQRIP